MGDLYRKPLRVYLILSALGLWGIISGMGLSTSLFPMSSQTTVAVSVGYGSFASTQFFDSVGQELESQLAAVKSDGVGIEKITADYQDKNVYYRLQFGWGADPERTLRAVENVVKPFVSRFEEGIRNSTNVYSWRENQGFVAISFYSPLRSLDEVYKILDPLVKPIAAKVQDAEGISLYNPTGKEVKIEIIPEKMAQFEITTTQIEAAINDAIFSLNGGSLKLGETEYQITLPKRIGSTEFLGNVRVSPLSQKVVLLNDISTITVGPSSNSTQRFKTSGVESLILFANPKEGGNVKRMSDDIVNSLKAIEGQWPKDIQYKILVNPADFINKSIQGVLKEVGLAAFLAVVVLFVFLGSFKNVVTAAIEIPLSLTMAFILMQFSGMNLNLISLGGLALSAGMNVDASVVVLENIFRHFEGKNKNLSYEEKARIVIRAVDEVKMPIISSTIASLVVFMPLIFTKGLTNSLLGDLAKAVVFSHGLSAFVALLLVPTIRLHLLAKGDMHHGGSPLEGMLKKLDAFYHNSLRALLKSNKAQFMAFGSVIILLPLLAFFVVPSLKKEVIGSPESDWLIVGVNSPLITSPAEMESELEVLEQQLYEKYPNEILYTFTQVYGGGGGNVMLRLKTKDKIEELQTNAEDSFKNTATKSYWVTRWNPSELRIPNPPEYRIELMGGTPQTRQQVSQSLTEILRDPSIYENVNVRPTSIVQKGLVVASSINYSNQPEVISRGELAHYLRTATDGSFVANVSDASGTLPVILRMPTERAESIENISALPLGFEGKLIPLGALAKFSIEVKNPPLYRENQVAISVITSDVKKNASEKEKKEKKILAKKAVDSFRTKLEATPADPKKPNPIVLDVAPDKELTDALDQLKVAIAISVLLIFLVMVIQLGDVFHSLLVLVAIPLGLIGVVSSLYLFGSSLSLNSGLGTILLNGIAVANSIILVDFIRRNFEEGKSALDATLFASVARMRPILMTSLTTILGMMPIAIGMGEGGKTLQPLGIAVSGGLWVSTLLTLYFVPCLQFQYLRWKSERKVKSSGLSSELVP
jgi:hydrophobic/amphiphilic exporter-1 (mainly G- bacteria), HAE1 family